MNIQPYLFFEGRCEEAIEFYRKALGAQVEFILRIKDSPEPPPPGMMPPGSGEKLTHASILIGETRVLASDGLCSGKPSFAGFSLTLRAADDADAKRRFDALSEGGQVEAPLTKTFFATSFGMVRDRFGVPWMVIAGG